MIRLENLTKLYGSFVAVDDIIPGWKLPLSEIFE